MNQARTSLTLGAFLIAGLGCLALSHCRLPQPPPRDAETLDLGVGLRADRQLGESHAQDFDFRLESGQYLRLTVHQRGVDVVLAVSGPEGPLFEVDGPTRDQGVERVVLRAETTGVHHLRIESSSDGSYAIEVHGSGPASATERDRARAAKLFYQASQLRRDRHNSEALEQFSLALERWQLLGDSAWIAETQARIGWCYKALAHRSPEHRRPAIEAFRSAVKLFHDRSDEFREGQALGQLGLLQFTANDTELAIRYFELALRIWQRRSDTWGEASLRINLATAYRIQGRVREAQDHYERARDQSDAHGLRVNVATAQHDLGTLFRALGKWPLAQVSFDKAMAIWKDLDAQRSLATTLNQLGQLHLDKGELEPALDFFHRALKLRQQIEDRAGKGSTLWRIGRIEQALDRPREALASCSEAEKILDQLKLSRNQASSLLCLASLLQADPGQRKAAIDARQHALELVHEVGDQLAEAEIWGEIAGARYGWGDLRGARQAVGNALRIAEQVRGQPRGNDLRMAYFATFQPIFDLGVEVLTDLGLDQRAFELNERSRSRSLLDLLNRVNVAADPQLAKRQRELNRSINATVAELSRLDAESQPTPLVSTVEARLLDQLAKLDETRSNILERQSAPLQTLDLAAVQDLLDPHTVLLAYRLGERRSHLWLVTPERFESFELADRQQIETAVFQAYEPLIESFNASRRSAAEIALCKLGQMILAPAAELVSPGSHLLVAPDGALRLIPFAALPDPAMLGDCLTDPSRAPLLEGHLVSYLPSGSTLAALRKVGRKRRPAPRMLAVLADPVFHRNDPLLPTQPLPQLPQTRHEADAILALLPPGSGFSAMGFEATKDLATSGDLAHFRIVHFATHGKLNERFPELSYLALSRLDPQDRPLDGDLRAHEIHDLDIPAELVVLSACESALGQEVAGEGLVGLTQGFFSAGASRVMVSLWEIGDDSTRALMSTFYEELLRGQQSPAAALRQAQLALRRTRQHSSPFAWAAWVIQGEWRPLGDADPTPD